jgi:hypothetical protein
MQWMVLREISEDGASSYRHTEQVGELDECREGTRIAPGAVGQDHRVARGD